MAVLKSTAYGQVRKSVGSNNYYRRAGVQIVRSKPTFAPGRTFTPAQLAQQWRMQVAQYGMLTLGLGKCSNCANVINNRLYNASSRYNRMVQQIMINNWEYGYNEGMTPEQAWNSGWDSIMEKWSIGDVKVSPVTMRIRQDTLYTYLDIFGAWNAISELVRLTNKRRRQSGYLSMADVGVCGMVTWDQSNNRHFLAQLPEFAFSAPESPDQPLTINLAQKINPTGLGDVWANVVLFIADGRNSAISAVDIVALHCTDSTGWGFVEK